jgi:hypothetical protein
MKMAKARIPGWSSPVPSSPKSTGGNFGGLKPIPVTSAPTVAQPTQPHADAKTPIPTVFKQAIDAAEAGGK